MTGIQHGEPVLPEMWRAINVNRRMDGAEEALGRLFDFTGEIVDHINRITEQYTKSQDEQKAKTKDILDGLESQLNILREDMESFKAEMLKKKRLPEFKAAEIMQQEIIEKEIVPLDDLKLRGEELQDVIQHSRLVMQADAHPGAAKESTILNFGTAISQPMNVTERRNVRTARWGPLRRVIQSYSASKGSQSDSQAEETELQDYESELQEQADFEEFKEMVLERLDTSEVSIESLNKELSKTQVELQNGIDNIRQELEDHIQYEKQSYSALKRETKHISSEVHSLSKKLDNFIQDQEQNLNIINEKLDDLNQNKAETTEVLKLLDTKLDKSEFGDFHDIRERIDNISFDLAEQERDLEDIANELRNVLEAKLDIEEYNERHEPLVNQMKSLLSSLRNLKEAVQESIDREAAAVTKCLCCGHPATIAGAKYISCRGDGIVLHPRQYNPEFKNPDKRESSSDSDNDDRPDSENQRESLYFSSRNSRASPSSNGHYESNRNMSPKLNTSRHSSSNSRKSFSAGSKLRSKAPLPPYDLRGLQPQPTFNRISKTGKNFREMPPVNSRSSVSSAKSFYNTVPTSPNLSDEFDAQSFREMMLSLPKELYDNDTNKKDTGDVDDTLRLEITRNKKDHLTKTEEFKKKSSRNLSPNMSWGTIQSRR